MSLAHKRILITTGPTWVPIDNVRVISNLATGETGKLLAEKLLRAGAKVTLLLGPVGACSLDRRIRLINFRFFDELKACLNKELCARRYDIVIQAAAVSDYKPARVLGKKVRSGKKNWNVKLSPAPKLIKELKTLQPCLRIVGFKFEPDLTGKALIERGKKLLKNSRLNWVVANSNKDQKYCAYVIDRAGVSGPLRSKKKMAEKLVNYLGA